MAEETGKTSEGQEGQQQTEQKPPETPPAKPAERVEDLPDWAQKLIRETRAEAAKHRKDKQAVEGEKQQSTSAAEELQKRIDALEEAHEAALARSAEAEKQALRARVALAAGLPEDLAVRLQGDTEDALKKDAEALKAYVSPVRKGDHSQGRGPTGSEKLPENARPVDRMRFAYGQKAKTV